MDAISFYAAERNEKDSTRKTRRETVMMVALLEALNPKPNGNVVVFALLGNPESGVGVRKVFIDPAQEL